MNLKKKLFSIILASLMVVSQAQSAILFFPVGLLVYLSPECSFYPELCLILDESDSTNSIQEQLRKRYAFLDDQVALETLGDLIEEKLPESITQDGTFSVSIDEKDLIDQVLEPAGYLESHPQLSTKLIEDLK